MKYLDLTGTTSNSFTIGVGTNSTELRIIDGILHYRNYGSNYKPLLNDDANSILSPLIWSSGVKYEIGNLIYYGGALFQVILEHTSTSIFAQNNAYRKVSDIGNFTSLNVDLQSSYSLNLVSSQLIYIFGNTNGSFNLSLPDITSIRFGSVYEIRNDSPRTIILKTNSGINITTLNSYSTVRLTLTSASNGYEGWVTNYYNSGEIDFGIQKVTLNFEPNIELKLIGPSGVFIYVKSGVYKFFVNENAKKNREINYNSGASNVQVITFSDQVISGDIPGKFCFFNTNDVLYLKNSTNITKVITFHKMF